VDEVAAAGYPGHRHGVDPGMAAAGAGARQGVFEQPITSSSATRARSVARLDPARRRGTPTRGTETPPDLKEATAWAPSATGDAEVDRDLFAPTSGGRSAVTAQLVAEYNRRMRGCPTTLLAFRARHSAAGQPWPR